MALTSSYCTLQDFLDTDARSSRSSWFSDMEHASPSETVKNAHISEAFAVWCTTQRFDVFLSLRVRLMRAATTVYISIER